MFLEDFLKEEVYCHFLTPKVVTNYSINDTTRIHIYSNISPPFHTPSLHCRLWLSPFKCLLTGLDYLTSFHLFYLCSNRFWVGNQLPTLLNWISNSHAKARAHSLIWKVVNSLLILNFYYLIIFSFNLLFYHCLEWKGVWIGTGWGSQNKCFTGLWVILSFNKELYILCFNRYW